MPNFDILKMKNGPLLIKNLKRIWISLIKIAMNVHQMFPHPESKVSSSFMLRTNL